jgi:uncharacterized membrane protein
MLLVKGYTELVELFVDVIDGSLVLGLLLSLSFLLSKSSSVLLSLYFFLLLSLGSFLLFLGFSLSSSFLCNLSLLLSFELLDGLCLLNINFGSLLGFLLS